MIRVQRPTVATRGQGRTTRGGLVTWSTTNNPWLVEHGTGKRGWLRVAIFDGVMAGGCAPKPNHLPAIWVDCVRAACSGRVLRLFMGFSVVWDYFSIWDWSCSSSRSSKTYQKRGRKRA